MAEKDTSFRWQHWSVTASKEKLLQLLDNLDASLPGGWQKLVGESAPVPRPMVPNVYAGYRLEPREGLSGVTLYIDLVRDAELRGGLMTGKFPSTFDERAKTRFAGADVDRFLDDGLRPAAAKVGVEFRKGTVADIFFDELPWEVQQSLSGFNSTCRKTLPLNRGELAAWQAFVIAAYRGPDNASYEPLVEWLVAQGWSRHDAKELTERFFDQFQLLTRYRETLVVA